MSILSKLGFLDNATPVEVEKIDKKRKESSIVTLSDAISKVKFRVLRELDELVKNPDLLDLDSLYNEIDDPVVFMNAMVVVQGFMIGKDSLKLSLFVLDFFKAKGLKSHDVESYIKSLFEKMPKDKADGVRKYSFLYIIKFLIENYPDAAVNIFRFSFISFDFFSYSQKELKYISSLLSNIDESVVFSVFEDLYTEDSYVEVFSDLIKEKRVEYDELNERFNYAKTSKNRAALNKNRRETLDLKNTYFQKILDTFFVIFLNGSFESLNKVVDRANARGFVFPDVTDMFNEYKIRSFHKISIDLKPFITKKINDEIDKEDWENCTNKFRKAMYYKYRHFDSSYLDVKFVIETCNESNIEVKFVESIQDLKSSSVLLLALFNKWKSFNLDSSFITSNLKLFKNRMDDDLLFEIISYLKANNISSFSVKSFYNTVSAFINCPKSKALASELRPKRPKRLG